MDIYSQRLRDLRGRREIGEIAGELGVSLQAMQDYESGKRRPRDEVLNRMVLLYRVPLAYLRGPVFFFLTGKCTDSVHTKRKRKKSIFLIRECTKSA